jgi:hypothetical protein
MAIFIKKVAGLWSVRFDWKRSLVLVTTNAIRWRFTGRLVACYSLDATEEP